MKPAHRGNRTHIVIAGRCNTGKSSVLNCLTGQTAAIVSDKPGTTADPVSIPFELLPYGPVIFYDTAGLDEPSELGKLRRDKSFKIIETADVVILVIDEHGLTSLEKDVINFVKKAETPLLVIANKTDIRPLGAKDKNWLQQADVKVVSAVLKEQTESMPLREAVLELMPALETKQTLISDLVPQHGLVVCVIQIDLSAPKGRLIAPQIQLLRELTDNNLLALITQPATLKEALNRLALPPDLIVSDSQAVAKVARIAHPSIPLTTFSLLFSRLKGNFRLQLEGAKTIGNLKPGDSVLIAEACSHHAQKDDIAKVKIPQLLEKQAGGKIRTTFASGIDFSDDLKDYKLVLHCGACMLSRKQMQHRLKRCADAGCPVTNYGMAISFCHGVLEQVAKPILKRFTNNRITRSIIKECGTRSLKSER